MHRVLLFLSVLAVAFMLSACDSNGSNDEDEAPNGAFTLTEGSFEATVDDDGETLDLSGGAVFGLATTLGMGEGGNNDGEGFVVYMLDGERPPEDDRSLGDPWTEVRITGRVTEVPGADTYEFGSAYRNDMDSHELRTFIGGGPGTFTITSASDDALEGTFSFEDPGDGSTQVEGTFTAARADDIDAVLCTPDCDD